MEQQMIEHSSPYLSVVIPVFNEEESIETMCDTVHAAVSKLGKTYEVVLVDDGSRDATWEKLTAICRRIPNLKIIRFRRNFGQTAAMSAGFHAARGQVIVTLDADLQNDPADIHKLIEIMEKGADVVSGWRKDRKDTFINRRLPSIAANWLIGRITGVRLHDYGCTLKAYRREVMENVHLYGEMHRFIPALASWVGARVEEVVVQHHPRRFGKSKYGISRLVRVALDLITVNFLQRYSKSPIQMFGKLGLCLFAPGFLMLGFMAFANLSHRMCGIMIEAALLIKRPFWVMTAFMLMFFGVQLIGMGLLAEIQIRTYHESQGKPVYVIRETIESSVK